MAVTFDSAFEKGASAQSGSFSFVSNAGTVSGSVGANSNRVLVAYIGSDTALTSLAMSWNGVSMTAIGTVVSVAPSYRVQLFGLINPATGANTLGATYTGSATNIAIGAVSLYNCDQTTGWQNATSATGTSTAPSLAVTSANGNMVVVGGLNDNGSAPTIAAGTSAWIESSLNGNYFMGYQASSGGSTTVTWTTSNVAWGVAGVDVIAFGGGGSDVLHPASVM